jgi:glycerophosphoryl diester phosphodiesterase
MQRYYVMTYAIFMSLACSPIQSSTHNSVSIISTEDQSIFMMQFDMRMNENLHDHSLNSDMFNSSIDQNDAASLPLDPPLNDLERKLLAGPPPSLYDCRSLPFMIPSNTTFDRPNPNGIECLLTEDCDRPLVVGHRGVGGDFAYMAPENSLAAIRAALVLGLDGVELDVRHTQDHALVLMHDSTLERTTGHTEFVSDLTVAELTQIPLLPPALRSSSGVGDFECESIPTLREALVLTQNQLFVDLDLKTNRVDLIIPLIEELDMMDQVYFSTSQVELALVVKRLSPQARIQIRPNTVADIQEQAERFNHVPEIFEIPMTLIEDARAVINGYQSKIFTDVWGLDAQTFISGEYDLYLLPFEQGAHVIQSEMPLAVLHALDRN